jgi:DNA invertase Pin-like site-specific DNA recombinase
MNIPAIALFKAPCLESPHTQEHIREFAEVHNLNIIAFYGVNDGGALAALLHAESILISEKAKMILIDAYKTIAVPIKDLQRAFDIWAKYEISLACVQDNIVLNHVFITSFKQILLASVAKEHEERSAKIKQSLKVVKQSGVKLGGKRFGISAKELTIIQQILKLYEMGFSLKKICDLLASNNIKTATNKRWHPTTVKRIVERTKVLKKGGNYEK